MGYTHYWTQRGDFKVAEFATVTDDLKTILVEGSKQLGLVLTVDTSHKGEFWFNGMGDNAHETFVLTCKRPPKEPWASRRGFNFCKTAQKPYDVAVVACLCYLGSITDKFEISSDGYVNEWLAGLSLAKLALPTKANQLQIPITDE